MASGDTVLTWTNLTVNRNMLSFRRQGPGQSSDPGDDTGFESELNGSAVETASDSSSVPIALGVVFTRNAKSNDAQPASVTVPPLDSSKTYDVIIKEH
jgi:hypothetical protein